MKKVLILCFLCTLFSCTKDRPQTGELKDYLPRETAVVAKMQNPDLFFSHLRNNDFLKQNSEHPFFRELKDRLSIIDYFPHQKESLLALTPKGEDSFDFILISRSLLEPLSLDSIPNKQVETQNVNGQEIKKYILEGKTAYTARVNNISLLSSSLPMLKNSLEAKPPGDPGLETAFKAASQKKPSVFINHERSASFLKDIFPSQFSEFSEWTVLDTDVSQTAIAFNGITSATDSLPHLVNVFKEVGAVQNTIASVTPSSSEGFTAVSFRDFQKLEQNLDLWRGAETSTEASAEINILNNATEAGIINLPGNPVLAIRVLDPETAKTAFDFELKQIEDYRGFPIFEYPNSQVFQEILQPLLNPKELHFFTFLDTYILFASTSEALKEVIAAAQNDLVLANTEAYIASSENLSTEASLLLVKNNQAIEAGEALKYDNFPVTALQFIYQDDFAHVHGILSKSEAIKTSQGTAQAASIDLGAALATRPVFFKNHRSNGMDIAVQDVQNTLYLISPEGKIFWKKNFDSRILGEVQTVDILRNGRYQLAFATQNELHVIDRDGNPVKPFPLRFRDNITQPLAVFDYDNNKDYRFLVVQGDELYMYDRKGNRVKGFDFSGTEAEITQTPKHLRIGRKDYIVIPEASGNLNILSRTGDIRVAVKENLDLTQNEWYEYEENFVSSNGAGQLIKITEAGKISREDLNLADNHGITATEKTLVTLSDNELSIKGNKVTLDFGLYSKPQIFYINNKIYVSVTDLQAHKVYLFDSNAALLNGFPLYGNSLIDLSNADGDAALELVVKGEDDGVLVYEVN